MEKQAEVETTRYKNLPKLLKIPVLVLFCAGIALIILYIFQIGIKGWVILDISFYYLLIAVYLCAGFFIIPARKRDKSIPWYDIAAACLAFAIPFYFFLHGQDIRVLGWSFPSTFNFVLALILLLLVLEAGRRVGGVIYLTVCIIFGLYPLIAEYMPGMFYGRSFSFINTVGLHIFGSEGVVGVPSKVMAEFLIGFLIFAGILIASGAGEFFLNFALALLGKFRGGPAKVAVVSSGFFGSLTGSVVSNVVSTGSVTIPAMKRLGYPAHYAGAIEACASTGGILMPPIMGAVAFVMCTILGIEYAVVIIAAAIPAILYYFGLLVQVDAYAARAGIKGLPSQECPPLKRTLRKGWPFITVLGFLVWGLVYMRWERLTPFYASGLMIILSFASRETMITPRRMIDTLVSVGRLITQTYAVFLPIGIIIVGLTLTGVSGALTSGLVKLGGENLLLVLMIGAATCYILGMAGLLTPAYIFLAMTFAPAISGIIELNVLAVHLFIVYYAMLACITPPVGIAAFVGATVAGAPPMKTGFQAMRLGIVIYFIPFFFLFNPSLILQGQILETFYLFPLCLIGITFIAGGMEGYLIIIGEIGLLLRLFLVIAGLLISFPEWKTTIIGAIFASLCIVIALLTRRIEKEAETQ